MTGPRHLRQIILPTSFCVVALFTTAPAFSKDILQTPSPEPDVWLRTILPQSPAGQPGAAGMVVHIDPQTGAVLSGPAPGSVPLFMSAEEQNAFSTSHQGLVEVQADVPGGGFKLDLQGRFQSPLFVTVQPDSESSIQHLGEEPGAH